jgi:hypothetical protein
LKTAKTGKQRQADQAAEAAQVQGMRDLFAELLAINRSEGLPDNTPQVNRSRLLLSLTEDMTDALNGRMFYEIRKGTGELVLRRRQKPTRRSAIACYCDARTRKGTPCKRLAEPFMSRCRLHGGCSTGPKTEAGRQAIAESNRRRAKAKAGSCGTSIQGEAHVQRNSSQPT